VSPSMSESRLTAVEDPSRATILRTRIADGSYRIDPGAVADAIIARHGGRQGVQRLCSEMLVAPQAALGGAGEREPLTGHDAA
jgi:hypothetical protein